MKNSRKAKYSHNLHTSKSRASFYSSSLAKKIVLVIIAIVMVLVIGTVVCSLIFTKENQIKWQISKISKEYYENYYYENLIDTSQSSDEIYNFLEKHHEEGLSNVTLNVLLSYDNRKNIAYEDSLGEYCNRNATLIKIYPDPPYDKKSYHIEYTYSCNYE